MADTNAEQILAANAVEMAEATGDAATAAAAPSAVAAPAATAEVAAAAAATPTPVPAPVPAPVAAVAAAVAATPAAATAAAAAAPATAAAAAAPVVSRPFNMKWLLAAEKNRQHFADELFNTTFSQESVEKVVQELKTITETKIANSYRLCEDDHTYTVQIVTHGWLRVPTHLTRIELPYSVLAEDSAVCIFVRDLRKPPTTPGRNAKQPNLADLTVRHYEQLLTAAKVDISNVTIIPLSVLFNEHTSLDQRLKLTYLYDKFLVEAPVATRVNAFLGSKLLYEAHAAFPIDLRSADLATEFDTVIRQVFYQSHQATDHSFVRPQICVGRESQDSAQIAENIIDLLGQLGSLQPGGAPNISALYLRASGNVATVVELYRDPATSAPEIPEPEAPEAAVVKMEDGTEVAAPVEEKLTVTVPNLTQHIIDNSHYIVYDGEDDYAEEFGVVDANAGRHGYEKVARGAASGAVGVQRRPLAAGQQQQYQSQQQSQQQQQQRAGASGVKRAAVGGQQQQQQVAGGGSADVDALVLRGLKKLLGAQNLTGLMHQNGGGQQQQGQQQQQQRRMQQNGGGQNGGGYVVRRPMNQQQQQQMQQYRGGVMGRNPMGGGNVMRRRQQPQQMNGGGGGGPMRQNRRYI